MKVYIYPQVEGQSTALVAATSPAVARRYHPEAREATPDELGAAIASLMMLPVAAANPRHPGTRTSQRYASIRDFVGDRSRE